MKRSRPALLLALLALGACHDKAAEGPVAGGGEVLPGSASDAMIAYDTLRSQPPLVPRAANRHDAAEAVDDGEADSEPDPGPEDTATPPMAMASAPATPAPPAPRPSGL